MKKQLAETNGQDSKLARRDFVRTSAAAGAGLLIVPSAIAFGQTFSKECDVGQGFNFKPDVQRPFGYINTLRFGDNNIAPDIKVVAPAGATGTKSGSTGGATADTSGTFTKAVVGVLSQATWSTLANGNITFQGRISAANMQRLNMLVMQSQKKVVVALSFMVNEYSPVSKSYFPSLTSYKGTVPSGVAAQSVPPGDASAPIYAVLGSLKIDSPAKTDPLGITNYSFELMLAPTIASMPQQIMIQTSATNKLVKPFGLPQN